MIFRHFSPFFHELHRPSRNWCSNTTAEDSYRCVCVCVCWIRHTHTRALLCQLAHSDIEHKWWPPYDATATCHIATVHSHAIGDSAITQKLHRKISIFIMKNATGKVRAYQLSISDWQVRATANRRRWWSCDEQIVCRCIVTRPVLLLLVEHKEIGYLYIYT